jgi:hypothetical protein
MAQTAKGRSGDLELAVAIEQTALRVSLINRSGLPLRVYFAVEGPQGKLHDFLTAELGRDGVVRTLRFTGDRNSSTTGLVELGPQREVTDDLDLLSWARDPVNGGQPLAAGEYQLTAVYRVDQPSAWSGEISAGPVTLLVT